MILLPNLDYEENRALDFEISEYVNDVLESIVRCVREVHADNKLGMDVPTTNILEDISPTVMFREDPGKCERTLEELYEMICSTAPRRRIHPRYQFCLFHCIEWYIEFLNGEDDFLIRKVPKPLRRKIVSVYGKSMIESMSEVKEYENFCFGDWDFLPEHLSGIVCLYLSNSPFFHQLITVEELDDYIELMDADQKEQYQRKRSLEQKTHEHIVPVFSEKDFVKKLLKALIQIQRSRRYIGAEENEINDELRDQLGMVYDIHDQIRQGTSESGAGAGEIDLLVFHNSFPVAIIEALKLNSVNKAVLTKHISKALVNYDRNGLPYAFIVIYATPKNFVGFYDSVIEYIEKYEYPYKINKPISEIPLQYAELRHAITILERNGHPVHLHFMILNMNENQATQRE